MRTGVARHPSWTVAESRRRGTDLNRGREAILAARPGGIHPRRRGCGLFLRHRCPGRRAAPPVRAPLSLAPELRRTEPEGAGFRAAEHRTCRAEATPALGLQ